MAGIGLYEHQRIALGKIKNGSILTGGVGSGKSRTALAYYYLENGGVTDSFDGEEYIPMDDVNIQDLYIITTAKKRDDLDWDGELIPFLLSRDPELNLYGNNIFIDSWNNIKKYSDVKHAFFIFDEQRVIGNGAWTKAFYKIAKANNWILLSATPGDTWMDYIPVFIANGFYKNKTEFTRRHVEYSRFSKYPKIEGYREKGHLLKLRDSILVPMPFARTTVRHKEIVRVGFNKELYKSVMKNRWNYEKDRPIKNATELCYFLRKIINTDPSRLDAVSDLADNNKRLIIFYNYNYELDLLKELFEAKGVLYKEWNGQKHEHLPDTDEWVYLVQYTAGNEGWNCVTTNQMIFYSLNYSYRIMEQSSGRIDRLNTKYKDLYYYYLESMASIELSIKKALANKKKFNQSKFVA